MEYLKKLRNGDSGGHEPTLQDEQQIAEILYDLNRVISESFIQSPQGETLFDPSILVVKILDAWQNLQTPGFWRTQLTDPKKDAKTVAKLVRARILTNAAEFLGMRKVASDMTMRMAVVQHEGHVDFDLLRNIQGDKSEVLPAYEVTTQKLKLRMKITHELTLGVSLLFKQRCCLPSV